MRATTRAEMQPRHTVAGSAPQACHDAWFDGKQAMATAGDRWKPNCPVCRLEFWPGESIEVLPRKLPKPATAASSAGPSSAGAGPSSANGGPSNSPNGPTYRDAYKRDDYRTLEPTDLAPISLAGLRSIRPDAAAHMLAATGLHPGSAAAASSGDVRSAKVARLLADLRNLGVDENGARRKAVVFSAHLSAIRHVETILQREGALSLFSLAPDCDAARYLCRIWFHSLAVGVGHAAIPPARAEKSDLKRAMGAEVRRDTPEIHPRRNRHCSVTHVDALR